MVVKTHGSVTKLLLQRNDLKTTPGLRPGTQNEGLKMKKFVLGKPSQKTGKSFYWLFLNTETGETAIIENADCEACARKFCERKYGLNHWDYYKRYVLFFLSESDTPTKELIPKKYHKQVFKS